MNRLTDDKTAEGIKRICDGLIAAGAEPTMSDRRYVKLAEYEQIGWSPTKIKALIDWSNSLKIKELYENEKIAEQYKWISVEDRMPEPLQNVIVCTDINTVTLAWINGVEWCFADQGNGKIERYGFEAVTHWMPLPEPPKEVQE